MSSKLFDKESNVESETCRKIETELGIKSLKLSLLNINGFPDRVFLIPGGRPLFIEFKRPGEKPEPLQKDRIKYLIQLGYGVKVCDNINSAFKAVKRAMETAQVPEKSRQVPARARTRRSVP